ncbi:MAG: nucleotidyl transferase AbiEii/AbiGii toxin family protein [Candidatus Woesearchaeota archaeon]|nr:nucleotidyl transferase AbiEii/AbiGii toxin family protein [Candidatus Woesearchaeota archaeon]
MISKTELKEYAKIRNQTLGQAEKDLFQNVLLFLLYQEHGKELVFKGGTALAKCYGVNRFSEDLDFTATRDIHPEKLITNGLKRYNVAFEYTPERILIQGPLYTGIRESLCSIRIQISRREPVHLDPKTVMIRTFTPFLPNFDVIVMDPHEIFAEKIRALCTREQARDLFDLRMIREFVPPKELVNKKLAYYKKKFSSEAVQQAIKRKQPIWEKELQYLVAPIPDFDETRQLVLAAIESIK